MAKAEANLHEKSSHPLQKLPHFAQQILNPPSLRDRLPGEQPVLARIAVALGCAGSRSTAMHAAAFFAAHGMRVARAAGSGLGAATRVIHLHSQSAAHRAALVLSRQFEEAGFDQREQAGAGMKL